MRARAESEDEMSDGESRWASPEGARLGCSCRSARLHAVRSSGGEQTEEGKSGGGCCRRVRSDCTLQSRFFDLRPCCFCFVAFSSSSACSFLCATMRS